MSPDELVWLYAVRLAGAEGAPAGPGVDGEAPRLVAEAELAAVVGTVAAGRFDEAGMAAAMEDLGRLEQLARAHHDVVVRAAAEVPVAPVRLATLYRDDDAVRRLLRERAEEFAALLRRVGGHREWGVKVYALPQEEREPAAAPAASTDRPGTAYLFRRRAERDRGARSREQARDAAERLHTTLAGRSSAAHRYPMQDARLSGRTEEMVLNAGYLVADGREAEFRDAVDAADDGRVRVELTGPWPAFSFTTWEEP
ncbi:GvpL/GvpF family gas vesicle protein [Pseudonocardia xishanensis]|uniref:GvpL/GvpF family gas vesicle protein n=1 Tax=Pseudonocardia xishanensis TaxID=630995 RepID=A0ABP8RUC2_9PSEU